MIYSKITFRDNVDEKDFISYMNQLKITNYDISSESYFCFSDDVCIGCCYFIDTTDELVCISHDKLIVQHAIESTDNNIISL